MESVLTTHFTKQLRALETQNSYELVICICLVVLFVITQASNSPDSISQELSLQAYTLILVLGHLSKTGKSACYVSQWPEFDPRTHMVKGEDWLPQVVLRPPGGQAVYMFTYTNK